MGSRCTYPGEFVPPPLSINEVKAALQKPHKGISIPLMNIAETPDAYTVELAAPGLTSTDFLVTIRKNVLSVMVLNKDLGSNKKTYRHLEFNYRCFKREIELPPNIDTDFLSAQYKNGILFILMPKSKATLVRDVDRVVIY